MTKEEYIAKMNEDHEWAPGWDAIQNEFDRLYPGQEPQHYGTNMVSPLIFAEHLHNVFQIVTIS